MEHKTKLQMALLTSILIILIGTYFYHKTENWGWVDSLYFSTTTITTVGLGDLYPTKDISKIFTVFYILFGVGAVLYAAGEFFRYQLEDQESLLVKHLGSVVRTKGKANDIWMKLKEERF